MSDEQTPQPQTAAGADAQPNALNGPELAPAAASSELAANKAEKVERHGLPDASSPGANGDSATSPSKRRRLDAGKRQGVGSGSKLDMRIDQVGS